MMKIKTIARLLFVINVSVVVVGIVLFLFGYLDNTLLSKSQFVYGKEDIKPKKKIPIGDIVEGEQLFKNNCAACHNSSSEVLVGPGLANISDRKSFDWIVRWVHNPQKVIKSGDTYANELYEKFNRAEMTAFPELNEKQISDIVTYLDN